MKLALVVGVAVLVGVACARRRRWTPPTQRVSRRWLAAQDAAEDRRGVDLPRWRFPRERAEIARRNVMRARFANGDGRNAPRDA